MAGYPKDYKKQEKTGDYMKLSREGDYRIRILRNPIIGYETWEETSEGMKPHRKRTFQEAVGQPSKDGKIKEFHAFIVWDYETSMVRLLNITQAFRNEIYDYSIDEDWGDLTGYDFVINRTGLTFNDTEYKIRPIPHKPMADEIKEAFSKVKIEEELYFNDGHPIVRENDENDNISEDVASALGVDEADKSEKELADKDLADEIPF